MHNHVFWKYDKESQMEFGNDIDELQRHARSSVLETEMEFALIDIKTI